jgi:hypothetical protein
MTDKCRLIRLGKTPETRQTKEIEMRALIAKIVHGAVDSCAFQTIVITDSSRS